MVRDWVDIESSARIPEISTGIEQHADWVKGDALSECDPYKDGCLSTGKENSNADGIGSALQASGASKPKTSSGHSM